MPNWIFRYYYLSFLERELTCSNGCGQTKVRVMLLLLVVVLSNHSLFFQYQAKFPVKSWKFSFLYNSISDNTYMLGIDQTALLWGLCFPSKLIYIIIPSLLLKAKRHALRYKRSRG